MKRECESTYRIDCSSIRRDDLVTMTSRQKEQLLLITQSSLGFPEVSDYNVHI